MADRNGYFQLVNKPDGTYIHFFPSQGEGKPVNVNDLDQYLSRKNISYEKIPVYTAAQKNEDCEVKIGPMKLGPVSETMVFYVSSDNMTVTSVFYPPSPDGSLMDAEEIRNDFKYNSIKRAPDEKVIEDFLANRQYCTNYEMVKGQPVTPGEDGYVEYLFDTDNTAKPKTNEDGTVDFHALNTVRACGAGQVLAIVHPEKRGEMGYDVFGEAINPKDVKKATIRFNRECELNENNELVSKIDGHVNLIEGQVFVSSVLEVNDVDVSTGDITYEGNLLVNGNITTGYKVNVTGDLEVKGVIEAAEVTAGGQITVAKGINGMEKGVVNAGASVVAKYINSAEVTSGGMVQSELILNSKVSAKDHIKVEGRKGFISGGMVRAGNKIEARTIGSDMGANTVVEVGVDPALKQKFTKLMKENEDLTALLRREEPVLQATIQRLKKGEKLPPDQLMKMQELNKTIQEQKQTLQNNAGELEALEKVFDCEGIAEVIVLGTAYAGTHISVSDANMTLKKDYQYCRFRREGADVKMLGI